MVPKCPSTVEQMRPEREVVDEIDLIRDSSPPETKTAPYGPRDLINPPMNYGMTKTHQEQS